MRKFIVAKKIILALLTLLLVQALIISGGCKKTDQAEDTQQADEASVIPKNYTEMGYDDMADLKEANLLALL